MERGERQSESWGCSAHCRAEYPTWSVASGSSGGSVPWSGSAGACHPSEHKRPETYPPDNEAVPIERRWPCRVRDLERRAEDPELLFGGGEDGHAINLNLFVCKRQALSPCGHWI